MNKLTEILAKSLASKLVIDIVLTSNTASAEGGISIAMPPVPRIGPMDRTFLYPRRDISGTISVPTVEATTDRHWTWIAEKPKLDASDGE